MMVSVVVPVYNVEKYLKKCVDSILAQTYSDYEIILVDDGSTDSSGAICDSYIRNDNIRVIHKKNSGLGMARNSGIEIAKGDYIAFLDSDDYWSPDALELLMSGIQKYGADTCIGGYTRITNEGFVILEDKPSLEVYTGMDVVKGQFFPRLMGSLPEKKDSFRPSVWNAVYSATHVREHNIRFPSEREYIAEDIMFDIDYYRYAKCVCVVESASYFYRVTPGSLTQKYKSDRFEKVVYLYKEVLKRLSERCYDNSSALRAKRQFFVYLKSCIKQENINISKLSKRHALQNIRRMCADDFTKEIVTQYPLAQMGMQQKVFLYLVKQKMTIIIYILLCRGKKRKGGKA